MIDEHPTGGMHCGRCGRPTSQLTGPLDDMVCNECYDKQHATSQRMGWECPRCGHCHGPHVDTCDKCPTVVTLGLTGNPPLLGISEEGQLWNDALLEEGPRDD